MMDAAGSSEMLGTFVPYFILLQHRGYQAFFPCFCGYNIAIPNYLFYRYLVNSGTRQILQQEVPKYHGVCLNFP